MRGFLSSLRLTPSSPLRSLFLQHRVQVTHLIHHLKKLLSSLAFEAHWRLPVIVSVAGASEYAVRHVDDSGLPFPLTYIETATNSFDITALIALVNFSDALAQLPLHSSVMLLHDTCFVGPNFTTQLEHVTLDNEISAVKLFGSSIIRPSMNIGLYGVGALVRIRDVFDAIHQ